MGGCMFSRGSGAIFLSHEHDGRTLFAFECVIWGVSLKAKTGKLLFLVRKSEKVNFVKGWPLQSLVAQV